MAKAKAKKVAKKAKVKKLVVKSKPNKLGLGDAILKGAKMVENRQCTGALFELNNAGDLCACASGAAILGLGLVDPKALRAKLRDEAEQNAKDVKEQYGNDELYVDYSSVNSDAGHEEFNRLYGNVEFDITLELLNCEIEPNVYNEIVDKNDTNGDDFRTIATWANAVDKFIVR